MIFTIVFVHTYHRYGILLYTRTDSHFCWQYLAHNCSCIKQLAWLLAVVQTFLTLASCKHFTVDVFVSWYTVNLVAFFTDKKLPGDLKLLDVCQMESTNGS
ncbi:hypothetical protein BDE02_09G031800 [Populus trichocarpa]|nr:hypothetical protein BDE02_09G031800 [Populus trichocarpa]